MTGKRFQISGSMVEDTMNIIPPTLWQIDEQKKKYCDELNYLYEENEDLATKKEDAEYELLHLKEKYEELLEENEQLRTKNNAYIQDIEVFKEENTHLKLENEQLKHQLQQQELEFATTCNRLTEENEQLRNRLKDWHQRTFKAHEYFNILEKVIDEVCDDEISNQIWKEYGKREKLIE